MTLSQEMRWAYTTTARAPQGPKMKFWDYCCSISYRKGDHPKTTIKRSALLSTLWCATEVQRLIIQCSSITGIGFIKLRHSEWSHIVLHQLTQHPHSTNTHINSHYPAKSRLASSPLIFSLQLSVSEASSWERQAKTLHIPCDTISPGLPSVADCKWTCNSSQLAWSKSKQTLGTVQYSSREPSEPLSLPCHCYH